MEIVLKNTNRLEEKIVGHVKEAAGRDDSNLVLYAAESIIKEVNLTLRGMNLGWVEYGDKNLHVTGLGVHIQVKLIDKYV
tara:strand:- start:619 stop:858 length:240 start_codon:yes stop_codon:yes gene_type:complete